MRIAPLLLLLAICPPAPPDAEWTELGGPNGLKAWKEPTGDWAVVGGVMPDPANDKRLVTEPGSGILVNGRVGRTLNLVSTEEFGDVEVYLEFLIPKGSNAGIKLQGLYEVQILDSFGKAKLKAEDCGGIYPRAELLPTYHHIDEGYPPKVNACKPPGEWQSMYITFLAPRFDESGKKKTADARFVGVVLNGQVVQSDLAVPTPTGHAYRRQEVAVGPLLLQADHGPIAFRSVKVRKYVPTEGKK